MTLWKFDQSSTRGVRVRSSRQVGVRKSMTVRRVVDEVVDLLEANYLLSSSGFPRRTRVQECHDDWLGKFDRYVIKIFTQPNANGMQSTLRNNLEVWSEFASRSKSPSNFLKQCKKLSPNSIDHSVNDLRGGVPPGLCEIDDWISQRDAHQLLEWLQCQSSGSSDNLGTVFPEWDWTKTRWKQSA